MAFLCDPCGRTFDAAEAFQCRICGLDVCAGCYEIRNETCRPCCNNEVAQIAEHIDIPVKQWPGNCYGIAEACLRCSMTTGKLRYGNWVGNISPDSIFAGRPFSHHAWIERVDKTIFDPTQWVFFGKMPYIYRGELTRDYDKGGNLVRSLMRNPPSRTGRKIKLDGFDFAPWFPKRKALYFGELIWLANLPPDEFGSRTKEIYTWLKKHKLSALVPIDNWKEVMEG